MDTLPVVRERSAKSSTMVPDPLGTSKKIISKLWRVRIIRSRSRVSYNWCNSNYICFKFIN
jgi:hypothetical protein